MFDFAAGEPEQFSCRRLDVYVDWLVDTPGEEATSTWEICAISPLVAVTLRRWGEELGGPVWGVESEGAAGVEGKCCVHGHVAFGLRGNSVG